MRVFGISKKVNKANVDIGKRHEICTKKDKMNLINFLPFYQHYFCSLRNRNEIESFIPLLVKYDIFFS